MYLTLNEHLTRPPVVQAPQYRVHTLHEKGSSDVNEDRLIAGEGLYGVFDGATSLGSTPLVSGKTGGALAAQIAKDTFAGADSALVDTAIEANRRIGLAQISAGVDINERLGLWSTSMAVVRIAEEKVEFCQTGDALIMLLHEDGSYRFLTPEIDIDRETMVLWKKLNDSPKSKGNSIYTALNQQILKVRLLMNREYGVLNGEPEAVDFIRHGSEDLTGVTDIILFTDGLYLPKEDPEQTTDWSTFIQIYRKSGLQGVGDCVRRLQNSDPALHIYPRFKMHDDIASISLSLYDPRQIL
ncbi:MAG: hypothetical protein ACI8ZB_003113 [Desulforhopalus sp.]|jgi:hypothetical protein